MLPSLLAIAYHGFFVADRYSSEAQFIVRSPGRGGAEQLSSLIQPGGPLRAVDEASAIHEFIKSRDAVLLLERKAGLRAILSRPEADPVWRFPGWLTSDLNEKLYTRYLDFVQITQDSSTGISTLVVQAFRPEDAVTMAVQLLEGSEALVNQLNERARRDTIQVAEREVEAARTRAFAQRDELTAFRKRVGIVDPGKTSSSLLETIGKLSYEIAQTNAQLSEALRGSPQSPQINSLRNRIQALEGQIAREKLQIGGTAEALAPLIADYERLILEREFADRSLASAMASREAARLEAQRQQLYLERIVEPRPADFPGQPKRGLWILISCAMCYGVYVILRSLLDNVRAHRPL